MVTTTTLMGMGEVVMGMPGESVESTELQAVKAKADSWSIKPNRACFIVKLQRQNSSI
jgi:hypothetical protein